MRGFISITTLKVDSSSAMNFSSQSRSAKDNRQKRKLSMDMKQIQMKKMGAGKAREEKPTTLNL